MFGLIRRVLRNIKYWSQRKIRGWSDADAWDVGFFVSKKTLPVLKKYRENLISHPASMTIEEWERIVDKIIEAMEIHIKDLDSLDYVSPDDYMKMLEGFNLFGKYFVNFWQ